ncbi:hypothetical protein E1212_25500 [Jiangella ureilytica]|uniref:Uncharacterized protein n=1 Tax=Jiangella ureilytica TaxID=2530374 RepID=A0A4V6PB00_9ACTN|nr:hypothetical protein [Jiangella ureilytica]TDC47005.1 hypothetical protein E1212_25500 [Jiangella ureilytica]
MADSTAKQHRTSVPAVAAAVVVVALAVVAAVWLTSRSGDGDGVGGDRLAVPSEAATGQPPAQPRPTPSATGTLAPGGRSELLPGPMGGQEAIDALGERLDRVAELNGMTPAGLRDALLTDASLLVAPSGRLLYDDEMTPPPTPR